MATTPARKAAGNASDDNPIPSPINSRFFGTSSSPSAREERGQRPKIPLPGSSSKVATTTTAAAAKKEFRVHEEEESPLSSSSPSRSHARFDGLQIDEDCVSHSPTQLVAHSGRGAGYNALKSFNGQVYSGMAVGGTHTWTYEPGTWHEEKKEPDLWKIDFETKKKRKGKSAPVGSGADVGTEYHWLIVAHQYVKKLDQNTYSTHLTGSKYKLAHKGSQATSWSVPTTKAQREREIELLEDAKQRIMGLPPVLASERVKAERVREKGQMKLDGLFGKIAGTDKDRGVSENDDKENSGNGGKRKREVGDDDGKESSSARMKT